MALKWILIAFAFVLATANAQIDQEQQEALTNFTVDFVENSQLQHIRWKFFCDSIGQKTQKIEEILVCSLGVSYLCNQTNILKETVSECLDFLAEQEKKNKKLASVIEDSAEEANGNEASETSSEELDEQVEEIYKKLKDNFLDAAETIWESNPSSDEASVAGQIIELATGLVELMEVALYSSQNELIELDRNI